jgi:hypothetical protein
MIEARHFGARKAMSSMNPVASRLTRLAQMPRVRAIAATVLLLAHLVAMAVFGASRFGLPFNAAPGAAIAFAHPATDERLPHWDRLLPARWDSEHYINLALRGYRYCPAKEMRAGKKAGGGMTCDLAFYPGYPLLGYLASGGGRLPVDWTMLGVSLLCSWLFLFLWTGPEVTEALGLRGTWVSLLIFNAFTTAFGIVTIHTEPLLLACTMGAFVLLARGRPWLAALCAGAGTGVRISGIALCLAFTAALAVKTLRERPVPVRVLFTRALMAALSGWGGALLMAYHWAAFGDPLLYVHSYERGYGTRPALSQLLLPEISWLARSVDSNLHEGIWVFALLMWLCLGGREALRGFSPELRAYWIALSIGVVFISVTGTISRSFLGMPRYMLVVLPAFFAAGKVLERRTLALCLWLAVSLWHYWQCDLCLYIGNRSPPTGRVCHFAKCEEAR